MIGWLDRWFEAHSRGIAHRTGRRNALLGVGRLMVGAAFALPVLPFDRTPGTASAAAPGKAPKVPDDQKCDYWRYCGVDGFLCSCCGGSPSTCPPGTEPSAALWVGTCHNPADGRDYLISYHDCCGKSPCGRCLCNQNIGDRPAYRMGLHNDINWCMANTGTQMFHCTTSVVVGVGEKRKARGAGG